MEKRLLFIQYFGLASLGVIGTLIGPLLPSIRADIGLSYSQAGLVLSGQSIGMLLTVLAGGYVADRFGKKVTLLAGSLFLLAGLALGLVSRSVLPLVVAMAAIGVGFGGYEVAINALCADTSGNKKGAAMNMLHVFFGLGAIVGPVLSAVFLQFTSWRTVLGLTTALPLLLMLFLPSSRFPAPMSRERERLSVHRSAFVWAAGMTMLLYVGIEVSIFGWLPVFWQNLPWGGSFPPELTAGVFWLSLTLGRLLAGRWSDGAGFGRFLMAICLGTFLLAAAWWIVPGGMGALVIVFLIGMSMAGIFPTIMISVTTRYPGQTGTVAGLLSIFSSFGGLLIPSSVGRLADSRGIQALPGVMAVLAFFMLAVCVLGWHTLEPRARREPEMCQDTRVV